MHKLLNQVFKLESYGTTVQTELRAGLVIFLTMAYIVVVNPAILEAAGIPKDACTTATILTIIFGTLLMSLYANRPFAIAPLMGENAFVAFTVCKIMGYSWQTALAAVFVSAILVTLISITNARAWLVDAIPLSLKYALAVGIGLFLTFIGLNETGIVALGVPGAPVHLGKINSPMVLLALFGLLLTIILLIRKIPGAILISIITTTIVGISFKLVPLPTQIVSLPPSVAPTFFKFDFGQVFTFSFFPILLTMFLMDFLDMMGTLIGCSSLAGFLDEKGNLPQARRPMLVDSIASIFSATVGTTTSGSYIESATGIQEGGRTGLTTFVVVLLFCLSLFFTPFLTAIPPQAYGPALIVVGLMMLSPITKINFQDYTELIPAFITICLMSFTYNIGVGLIAGFVLYPILKLAAGRYKEIAPGLWVLFALSLLFFIFYPY